MLPLHVNLDSYAEITQHRHYRQKQIHRAPADELAEFADIAYVKADELHHRRTRVLLHPLPIDRIEPIIEIVESCSPYNHSV